MAIDFVIPKVGEGVQQVTIVDWLVEDGTRVEDGQDILEIETDKATAAIPATATGYVHLGPYKPGDEVPILTVVATIGDEGGKFAPGEGGEASEPRPAETSTAVEEAESVPAALEAAEDQAEAVQEKATRAAEQPKATPVALKMAAEMGIDLSQVADGGRITKQDVLRAARPEETPDRPEPTPAPAPSAEAPAPPERAAPPPPEAAPGGEVTERIPLKGIRGVIARRMAESVQTTARVTLVSEVDATELVILRERLKAQYSDEWGFAPGYNDLLALMVANALRQFPFMNARLSAEGDAIERLAAINLGMAVDTERGLMVTIIRDVDTKGLRQFGQEFRELVDRAREGKSGPDDLSGGTFTITNLGMYRIDAFTPIIYLPQAAILGVGRITPKPVAKDDQVVVRKMMTLSLVFDHRLTDGAPAARFLDFVCELIEEPALMFLTQR